VGKRKSQKSYIPNLKNGALRRKNGKFDWLKIEGKISYFNLQTPKSCIILEIFLQIIHITLFYIVKFLSCVVTHQHCFQLFFLFRQ